MSQPDPYGEQPTRPSFDASPPRSTSPRNASFFIQLAMLGMGAAICLRIVWVLYASVATINTPARPQTSTAAGAATTAATQTPPAATTTADIPPKLSLADQAARLDAAKAQQREFLNLSEKLSSLLDQWQAALDKWKREFAALATSEVASPLAAMPESVKDFRAIYSQERPNQVRLDQIRGLAEQLSGTMTDAWQDPHSITVPEATASAQLQSLIDETKAAAVTYRSAIAQVEALLKRANEQGLTSDKPLREAIAAQEQVEQLAAVAKTRDRFEKAQLEADERIAAAKEEAIRIAGEVEARKIMAAASAARNRQLEEEEQHKLEQAKTARLNKMQRDMDDIRKYLRPFITQGYAQPGNADNVQTGESTAVSLSKLTACGALKDGREGMEKLMRCATVNNDRDHGAFPQYLGGDRGWQQTNKEFLKRAQQLLNDYGDLLVEKGLLSP